MHGPCLLNREHVPLLALLCSAQARSHDARRPIHVGDSCPFAAMVAPAPYHVGSGHHSICLLVGLASSSKRLPKRHSSLASCRLYEWTRVGLDSRRASSAPPSSSFPPPSLVQP